MPVEPAARRRESFDEVAGDYDRYRRRHPDEVVDDLVGAAGIGAGSHVLEIACGTGQLSVPLAQRGVELVAVELGSSLAEIARRHLAPFPQATVHVAAFEEWPLPAAPFDAVVCANAFHWLDPSVRFAKCAAALRPGGSLSILAIQHVNGSTPDFTAVSQRCYVEAGLASDEEFRLPDADDVAPSYPELDGDASFVEVERRRHLVERRYTADEKVGLLRTDSLVATVPAPARERFFTCIGQLIEARFGGEITLTFLHEIVSARRAG